MHGNHHDYVLIHDGSTYTPQVSTLRAYYAGTSMTWSFVDVITDYHAINDGFHIPRLDEWFEDVNHVRTGRIVISGQAFKAYYHAIRSPYEAEESTESIVFQMNYSQGTLTTASICESVFRKAVRM